ncbi:uncharacterized protein BDW70DRAFT_161843 [Aspergillus foveolatus]|uniref:uncharacterized protein n=1 Tax=Aspergillus foveolatus TaxID=210207 RepID=UPI003CCD6698
MFKVLAVIDKPARRGCAGYFKGTIGNENPTPCAVSRLPESLRIDLIGMHSCGPVEGTLYAVSSLDLVDLAREDPYRANALNRYLAESSSVVLGVVHLTTEALLAGPFAMRKLSTNLTYPFHYATAKCTIPYEILGKHEHKNLHAYSITAAEALHGQFEYVTADEFFNSRKSPGRLQELGYNLMSFVEASPETATKMADIEGKRGEVASQDYKEAFPSSLWRIYQVKNSA